MGRQFHAFDNLSFSECCVLSFGFMGRQFHAFDNRQILRGGYLLSRVVELKNLGDDKGASIFYAFRLCLI